MRSRHIMAAGWILAAVMVVSALGGTIDAGAELTIIERVVKARQDYIAALTDLVNYYYRSGDLTSSKRATRELKALGNMEQYDYAKKTAGAVTEEPTALLVYIQEAEDYYTAGKIIGDSRRKVRKELALQYFEKVLENWPTSNRAPEAAWEMGQIHAGLYYKDYDLAAEYYKKCYKLNPSTAHPALVEAGNMYRSLRRWDDAIVMYELAIKGSRDAQHKEKAEKAREAILQKLAAQGE